MNVVKVLMQLLVTIFFKTYFFVFGKPKISSKLRKTLKLYEKEDSFFELFSLIRVWDAPFEEIENKVPKKGKIIDLGCGDGVLTNYLALKEKGRDVLGIELNEERVKEADKGLENAKFVAGDILEEDFAKADCILLVHVLHHLDSPDEQIKMLEKIEKKLKKDGELIIVEIDKKPFLKYVFTWITDAITVPVLFEGKLFSTNFHYRSAKEWIRILKEFGYKIETARPHKGKPFSHVMFYCIKKP